MEISDIDMELCRRTVYIMYLRNKIVINPNDYWIEPDTVYIDNYVIFLLVYYKDEDKNLAATIELDMDVYKGMKRTRNLIELGIL